MRTEQRTVRLGEDMGPIDWAYDFASHYKGSSRADESCAEDLANLRTLADNPDAYQATTDGGWPRFGWGDVLDVCMYDGWPYWRPIPSVLISGTLGGEWAPFCSITSIRKKASK